MTKQELVHSIEKFIPNFILKLYRYIKRYIRWEVQQYVYRKKLKSLRKQNRPVKVLFILKDTAEWKYDSVYKLMVQDKCFEPQILVCPQVYALTEDKAIEKFNNTYDSLLTRGYNVIKACENIYDDSIEVDTLKPDIVFHCNMWTQYLNPKYNINKLRKYLKCYVNYGFVNVMGKLLYASAFHGLMWKYFIECEDLKSLAKQANPREMRNAVVTGYPICDVYESNDINVSMWKDSSEKYKRVIWAPHHSVEGHCGILKLSSFFENAEMMLKIAEMYADKIQFAFKPHPMLLNALYNHPKWGKKKTDEYYQKWAEGLNTVLINGGYTDLFKSSNALIHDCASFLVEYLYVKKPVLYLGHNRIEQSNIIGEKAYYCHSHGTNSEDVITFIEDIVLSEKDDMKTKREEFYNDILVPPNGCTVAENIVNEIKRSIWGNLPK